MEASQVQIEIGRLEVEATAAQERFSNLMGGLPSGASTIDEVCLAFRESSILQIDIYELRLRLMGDAIQGVGFGGLTGLDLTIPTIG